MWKATTVKVLMLVNKSPDMVLSPMLYQIDYGTILLAHYVSIYHDNINACPTEEQALFGPAKPEMLLNNHKNAPLSTCPCVIFT